MRLAYLHSWARHLQAQQEAWAASVSLRKPTASAAREASQHLRRALRVLSEESVQRERRPGASVASHLQAVWEPEAVWEAWAFLLLREAWEEPEALEPEHLPEA